MITNFIQLDFNKENDLKVPSVQYDSGSRFVKIKLQRNKSPFEIDGYRVTVVANKVDGTEIMNDCTILDGVNGVVQFEITEQFNAVEGVVDCQLKLFKGKTLLTSMPFSINVVKSVSTKEIVSSNELKTLVNALGEVQDIDNRFAQTNAQLSQIKSVKVTAEYLGMIPNTDITQRLKEVLEANNKYQIEFVKGEEYIISDTIIVDLFKNSILGNGCIFSSKIKDENLWTFKLTSSLSNNPGVVRNGGSPVGNLVNTFENCIIQTKKDDEYFQSCNGVFVANVVGKSAHLAFDNITCLGFNKGVGFGDNAYMLTFDKINIAFCKICVALEKGYTDMGERINFSNGCIGDSDLMILNETDQALHFHNMSLDFSGQLFDNSGMLFFTNCHLEAPYRFFDGTSDVTPHDSWGKLKSTSSVYFNNCRMLIAYGGTNNAKVKYLFESESSNTGVNISDCHLHVFANYICNDNGRVNVKNTHRYSTFSPFVLTQEKQDFSKDVLCRNIEYIKSSDASLPPIIDDGYKCTHKSYGVNTQHKITLPSLHTDFEIRLKVNSPIAKDHFFNSVRIYNNSDNSYMNFGTLTTVVGENVYSLKSFGNETNRNLFFNPYGDYTLSLQTFNVGNGTEFIIEEVHVHFVESL